ncbi:MAG: alanine--tRNA ligase [Planctomycetota bacterium]|nr:MAG: alanine--tRNA ligase [Planctomycetota bacterium]
MSVPRTGAEIREAYLAFFEAREHRRLPSDSLIPSNDPSLLFTVAGMVQFKEEFLGRGRTELRRATTSQKCIRVPDLENVGATPRHHTFFEMLGNFSFGDYFKAETIPWEWQFFTECLGWDPDRLVASIYLDDEEAFQIWKEKVGLPEERIFRFGEKENFWPAEAPSKGPNGPCGPCSEIYFDQEPGGPLPDKEGLEELPDRFVEVGNFVFTQFDRQDGGRLEALPQKNIDVGLGLERLTAVAQGAANNFETDLFLPVLDAIQSLSGQNYGREAAHDVRMRRIADHARAVFFCIADGAAPGRDGRGYVVRKILRRAVRDGIELGLKQPFLAELFPAVESTMGACYPELSQQRGTIEALVQGEEERFRDVYRHGIARLETALDELRQQGDSQTFSGRTAFELHDTYGFPADIAEVIVREQGFEYDQSGFEQAMEEQRQRARTGTALSGDLFVESIASQLRHEKVEATRFLGYEQDRGEAEAVALGSDGRLQSALEAGQEGFVVLAHTPFYAEGGGQIGDRGQLLDPTGETLFEVRDTQNEEGYSLHFGVARQGLSRGKSVIAQIDLAARKATEAHHTATHLLHAALKSVVGSHVNQAGSQVAPERLRFDFTHPEALSSAQIAAIEDMVNGQILSNQEVQKRMSSLEQARQDGVVALFGEKYGDEVRVVEVPGFSKELCGGCHVGHTGNIGPFRIVSERALAAGVRRLEAVAGQAALESFRRDQRRLEELEVLLKTPADRLGERVQALKDELKKAKSAKKAAVPGSKEVAERLRGERQELKTGDLGFAWADLPGLDAGALRSLADGLRKEDGLPDLVLLVGGDSAKVPFAVLCLQDGGPLKAGPLAKAFGQLLGGGGGGRPQFAQGQGADRSELAAKVGHWLQGLPAPA